MLKAVEENTSREKIEIHQGKAKTKTTTQKHKQQIYLFSSSTVNISARKQSLELDYIHSACLNTEVKKWKRGEEEKLLS